MLDNNEKTASAMILLISDQSIPNFIPVLNYHPAKVYMLYTSEPRLKTIRKNLASTIRNEITDLVIINTKVEALDWESTYKACRDLIGENGSTMINLTGGTKPMSFGAFQAGLETCSTMIYVDTENDSIISLGDDKLVDHLPNMKIKHFAGLIGRELDWQPVEFAITHRKQLQPLAEYLVKNQPSWNELCKKVRVGKRFKHGNLMIPGNPIELISALITAEVLAGCQNNADNTIIQLKAEYEELSWFWDDSCPIKLIIFYFLKGWPSVDDVGFNLLKENEILFTVSSQMTVLRFNMAKGNKDDLNNLKSYEIGGKLARRVMVMLKDRYKADKQFCERAGLMKIDLKHAEDIINNPLLLMPFQKPQISTKLPQESGYPVMISLFSDQLIPNFLAALKYKPEVIYLLITNDYRFVTNMHNFCTSLERELPFIKIQIRHVDAMNDDTTYSVCEEIIGLYGADNILINATGGTKMMSFGALKAGRDLGTSIMYVDTTTRTFQNIGPDNLIIPTPNELPSIEVQHFLDLQGVEVETDQTDIAIKLGTNLEEFCKKIVRNISEWKSFIIKRRSYIKEEPKVRKYRISENLLKEMKEAELINSYRQYGDLVEISETKLLEDHKVLMQEGTVLELYLYYLAAALRNKGMIDDVRTGLKFVWCGPGDQLPVNELDLVVSARSRLRIVSCKTGNWEQKDLDELEVYGDLLGGTFVSKILVYYVPPVEDFEKLESRAKDMKITLITIADILNNPGSFTDLLSK